MPPLFAHFFLPLSFLIEFFRACREFASYSRKIIENLQFAVQIEIFPKNIFLPYNHLLWALQLRPSMHQNSVPGRVFGSRRGLLRKKLRSVGHLQKLCKLFPQALIYLKGAMLIYRLMPPQVNSKTALTRCENQLETSKLDRWIASDPLYTLSQTSFLSLYK